MFNFLPGAGMFALAGLIAAAGPIVIHLLNRRRFRVVNWAAMDFLLEALQRNRRMLQLRDLLLLALRTAAVLLFGLALARPFLATSAPSDNPNEPLHAILVVDNSLSMGYQKLDRTLLDEAKARAKEFLEQLPEGSRVSVLPLCGSASGFTFDAYRTKEDARDALDKIEVVDRSGSAAQAADLARQAAETVNDMPAKRVVFLGDQQLVNWPAESLSTQLENLPEMQVVSVAADESENTWISDFSVVDGIADIETTTLFAASIRHEGPTARDNVQVVLTIDGTEVGSETIDHLEPGQTRELTFQHRFDVSVEPGKPVFVPAKISIPPDHLTADDERVLAVPVVAALPVVFIDQYGTEEDPRKNRYGETRHLRRLLAPVTLRGDSAKQLVQIRHVKIDQVDKQLLEDARLVVVAGVASPEGAVDLLREFVKQGGQLVIAAGADFDPAAWNQFAWQDGAGILPLALKPQPIGKLPEEASGELKPFFLAYDSMAHDYFHLADTPVEELKELYGLPLFFKAVEAEDSTEVMAALLAEETKRVDETRSFLTEADARAKIWADKEAKGTLTEDDRMARANDEQRRADIEPHWLMWPDQQPLPDNEVPAIELAQRSRPRVLAAFDNNVPYLVEREIGRGRVLFVASGMYSSWNNLPKTNTVLLFDRMLRGMLARTLPERNLSSVEQVTLPVVDRNGTYTLARPDGSPTETLLVEALGADNYGVTVRNVTQRGIYRVTAIKGDASTDSEVSPARLWEVPLAVNGPARESEPALIDEAGLQERMGGANYRWVGRGDRISLEGAQVRFQDLWKWLILLVLVMLLVEMAVLARPIVARERAT